MTHLRLWRFAVSPEAEQHFVEAYKPDGSWARLFGRAPGFVRTELVESVTREDLLAQAELL